jgi:hypothetical protein
MPLRRCRGHDGERRPSREWLVSGQANSPEPRRLPRRLRQRQQGRRQPSLHQGASADQSPHLDQSERRASTLRTSCPGSSARYARARTDESGQAIKSSRVPRLAADRESRRFAWSMRSCDVAWLRSPTEPAPRRRYPGSRPSPVTGPVGHPRQRRTRPRGFPAPVRSRCARPEQRELSGDNGSHRAL